MKLDVVVQLVLIVGIFLHHLVEAVHLINHVKLFTDVPVQHQLLIIVQIPPAVVLVAITILHKLNVSQIHAIPLIQEPARVMLRRVLPQDAVIHKFLDAQWELTTIIVLLPQIPVQIHVVVLVVIPMQHVLLEVIRNVQVKKIVYNHILTLEIRLHVQDGLPVLVPTTVIKDTSVMK